MFIQASGVALAKAVLANSACRTHRQCSERDSNEADRRCRETMAGFCMVETPCAWPRPSRPEWGLPCRPHEMPRAKGCPSRSIAALRRYVTSSPARPCRDATLPKVAGGRQGRCASFARTMPGPGLSGRLCARVCRTIMSRHVTRRKGAQRSLCYRSSLDWKALPICMQRR